MNELAQLLSDLVAINSINPDLVPGAPGEGEIARYIASWLERAGVQVELDESVPHRPSVLGIARGTGDGKTLLLNGHMDTVGVAGMTNPHTPCVENGRLYGRGAYDMKCGVVACMMAIAAARKRSLRGSVIFTAVVDEEYAGLGTMGVAWKYPADGAVVAESTHLQLIPSHKGFVWLDIETQGVAAHGSRPDLGVDAIAKMGRVLSEIEHLDRNLRSRLPHKLLGTASLHASLIRGGQELSSYPEHCVVSVERRTLPGEAVETVEAEIQEIIERVAQTDPAFKGVVRRRLVRTPLETPPDEEIVGAVREAATRVLGRAPEISGVPYWTDAATLAAAGIPAILFGPTGEGAHAIEEWVDLESVEHCAEIYLETAVEFCK